MNTFLAVLLALPTRPQEVRATQWGFDPDDSTKSIQSAIDSGARRVVIENTGKPWIVTPIRLASDQEIVFDKGVVLQAKRGAFRAKNDCLLSAASGENITLTGYGATLRMWKEDYQKEYEKSEWRHALSLRSCSNVRILGLTITQSGGDGIYLGAAQAGVPCRDVVIRDVVCDGNHRQGISVISAENLLIENCILKNTAGTAPQAGIDFEPNRPDERLANCVMRNCVSENNRGCGYAFWLGHLNGTSEPVSIRLENCRASGNSGPAFMWGTRNEGPGSFPRGTGDFTLCSFEKCDGGGIMVRGNPASGCRLRFDRCRISDCTPGNRDVSPITFTAPHGAAEDVGNAEFADCTVRDPIRRPPVAFLDWTGRRRVARISGSLSAETEGRLSRHTLDEKTLSEWIPILAFKDIPQVALEGLRLEPALPGVPAAGGGTMRLRGASEFIIFAEKDRPASFSVQIIPVGQPRAPAAVRVYSPSGREITALKATPGRMTPCEFTTAETGACRIGMDPGNAAVVVESSACRLVACGEKAPLHFFGSTGTFHFWTPAGTVEFGVRLWGGGVGEAVRASLIDPEGRKVEEKDNIVKPHLFVAKPAGVARGEAWGLRIEKPSQGVLEDYFVDILGVPPLLAGTPGALLKPVKP